MRVRGRVRVRVEVGVRVRDRVRVRVGVGVRVPHASASPYGVVATPLAPASPARFARRSGDCGRFGGRSEELEVPLRPIDDAPAAG